MTSFELTKAELMQNKRAFVSLLTQPKRVSYAIISILQQNIVTAPVYVGLLAGDTIMQLYIIVIMITQQNSPGTDMLALNPLEKALLFDSPYAALVAQTIVTFIFVLAMSMILFTIYSSESLQTLTNSTNLKKVLGIILILLMTVLPIPMAEIILRAFFLLTHKNSISLTIKIANVCLASFNVIFFALFQIVLNKLFIIRIPSNKIPWSASDTQLHNFKVINRGLIALAHCFYTFEGGKVPIIFAVVLFFTYFIQTIGMTLVMPFHNYMVDFLIKGNCATVTGLLLVYLGSFLFSNKSSGLSILQIMLLIIPCIYGLVICIQYSRKLQMLRKVKNGALKLELEYEYALDILIKKSRLALGSSDKARAALGLIFEVIDDHSQSCNSETCYCQKQRIVKWLMFKAMEQKTERLTINKDDIDFLNAQVSQDLINEEQDTNKQKIFTQFQTQRFYSDYGEVKTKGDAVSEVESQTVTIDISMLKLTFINRFLLLVFEDAKKKFPASKRILFQHAYFTLYCYGNPFLTETLIRGFDCLRTSWLEKVSISVNELHTIMEITQVSTLSSGQSDDKFTSSLKWGIQYTESSKLISVGGKSNFLGQLLNPEEFIMNSILHVLFYDTIETLSHTISQFWQKIQSDTLEVKSSYVEANKTAEIMNEAYWSFEELNKRTKSQDFKLIYTFALLQKFLLNDPVAHDNYINKLRSQRDINKVLKANYNQFTNGNIGFILVQGQISRFGSIIMSNQKFRKVLGYQAKDFKHKNINLFMPESIKQWHSSFVSDFNKTGEINMLNRNIAQFIVNKEGYITPVMLYAKFHYSQDYDFSFICYFNFLKEIQIQKNASKHLTKDVMFFLCDDQNGSIQNISSNCSQFLNLDKSLISSTDLGTNHSSITIEDLIPQLSFRKIKEYRKKAENALCIEEIVDIDLNIVERLTHNKQFHRPKMSSAVCQVFHEKYGADRTKAINIVAIILQDRLSNSIAHNDSNMEFVDNENKYIDQFVSPNDIDINNGSDGASVNSSVAGRSKSGSVQSGSSSHSNDSVSTQNLKQMYISTEKKTPRSLRIVVQLIFIVFVIIFGVSTLNLVLSVKRHESLKTEVETVRKSYDRIAVHSKTTLLLRGLLNMANGIEPASSVILGDRYDSYLKEYTKQINDLKIIQDFLTTVEFDYSQDTQYLLNQQIAQLESLDENGNSVYQNYTYNLATNLHISRMDEIQNMNSSRLKGRLNIQNMYSTGKIVPTADERIIFFVNQNSIYSLRYLDQIFSNRYVEETKQHALDVIFQTKITIYLSIATIIVVAIIISPLLAKIEERKYVGLRFFLRLNPECFQTLIDNSQVFLSMAFSDASVHTNITNQELRLNIDKDSQNLRTKHYSTLNHLISDQSYEDQQQDDIDNDDLNRTDAIKNGQLYKENADKRQLIGSDVSINDFALFQSSQQQTQIERPNNYDSQKNSVESSVPQQQQHQIYSFSSEELPNKQKVKGFLQRSDSEPRRKGKKVVIQVDEEEEEAKQVNQQMLKEKKIVMDAKYHRIKDMIYHNKTKTVLMILVIVGALSSYFIACYFMALKTFDQTPEIIDYLDLVYFKDACIENVITYVRESQIRNETIYMYENNTQDAVDYFVDICQTKERAYLKMRSKLPPVFEEIRPYIEGLEEDTVCNSVFKNSPLKQQQCLQAYHGIVTKGLSQTIGLVLSHYQNTYSRTFSSNRSFEQMRDFNRNPDTIELSELKDFILDQIFIDFKDKATMSTQNYYASLIQQYTILYAVFIVILIAFVLFFFLCFFKSIRDAMWRTNLTLKLMPLEFMPRQHLNELKAFFKQ